MVQAHLFHPTLSSEIRYSIPALLEQHSTNPNGGPLVKKTRAARVPSAAADPTAERNKGSTVLTQMDFSVIASIKLMATKAITLKPKKGAETSVRKWRAQHEAYSEKQACYRIETRTPASSVLRGTRAGSRC